MKGVTHVTAKQVAAAMQSFEDKLGDDPIWSEMKSAAVKPQELATPARPRQVMSDLPDLDPGVTR